MKALVTGGGGFLGKAIVRQLLARGDQVRSLHRGDHPELTKLGVEVHRGDIADTEAVSRAVEGCDVVFHAAARGPHGGSYQQFYRTNVVGTRNVIDACKTHGVPKLVYTSTPSVVHQGGDVEGVDESVPYVTSRGTSPYPVTKAMAEASVLGANSDELSTVALRPHVIWGPEDSQYLPRLIARHQAGKLRIIGREAKLVDSCYIDNAAEAHLRAADELHPGAACAGKAYFITQGEPIPAPELLNRMLESAGQPPVEKSIPRGVAYFVAWVLEAVYRLLGIDEEPRITRFVVVQFTTAHWYDISAAKRDFGWAPRITMDEGFEKLTQWWRQKAA